MNTIIVSLLVVSGIAFSRDLGDVRYFGEFGFGLTRSQFPSTKNGINSHLSITAGPEPYYLRISHAVNGVYSAAYPKDKLRANNLLLGRSFTLYTESDHSGGTALEWNIVLYSGITFLQNQAAVTMMGPFDDRTHLILENGYGIPLEMELQYLLPKYRGVGLNVFYNINPFRDYYGVCITFIVGYF